MRRRCEAEIDEEPTVPMVNGRLTTALTMKALDRSLDSFGLTLAARIATVVNDYTILHCAITYYIILYYTTLYYILYTIYYILYTILYYTILYYIAS